MSKKDQPERPLWRHFLDWLHARGIDDLLAKPPPAVKPAPAADVALGLLEIAPLVAPPVVAPVVAPPRRARHSFMLDRLHERWMDAGDSPLVRRTRRYVRNSDLHQFAFLAGGLATDFAHLALTDRFDQALAAALAAPASRDAVRPHARRLPHTWLMGLYEIATELARPAEALLADQLRPFWHQVRSMASGQRPRGLKNRLWEIYQTKLAMRDETGHYPTQQAWAERAGLSRERIQQIDATIARSLAPDLAGLAWLHRFLAETGPAVDAALFIPPLDPKEWILAHDLLRRQGIHLDEALQSLSAWPKAGLRARLAAECEPFLRQRLPLEDLTEGLVASAIAAWADHRGYPSAVVPPVIRWARMHLFARVGERWHWRRVRTPELMAAILLDYPEGCAIYREIATLRRRAEEIRPGAFHKDQALIAAIRQSGVCHMWARGIAIHRSYIRAQPADLAPVAAWLLDQFKGGAPRLSAFEAFERFAGRLAEVGVPNPYALYTSLRLFCGERFVLGRFPWIRPVGVE
jgi:hypothetical protein